MCQITSSFSGKRQRMDPYGLWRPDPIRVQKLEEILVQNLDSFNAIYNSSKRSNTAAMSPSR
jgi:hypothetical protein